MPGTAAVLPDRESAAENFRDIRHFLHDVIAAFLDRLRQIRRARTLSPDLATGRLGEDLAHRYLQRCGYTIVARNYRLSSGGAEADLIAWHKDELVIVEVKTRRSSEHGPPDRAIGQEKQRHLLRVAREYARRSKTPIENVRIDVVTIVLEPSIEIVLTAGALRVH